MDVNHVTEALNTYIRPQTFPDGVATKPDTGGAEIGRAHV